MTDKCFIESCLNKITGNLDFFSFPENELLHILWSQAIQCPNRIPDKTSKICSKHFKEDDFIHSTIDEEKQIKRLSDDAVPSLFLSSDTPKIKIKPETRHYHHHQHHQVSSSSSDSDEYIARNAPTKEKLKRKIKLLKQKINRFESKFENIKIQLKEELTKRNLTVTDAQSAMTLLTRQEFAYKFKPDNNSMNEKIQLKKLQNKKQRRTTTDSSSNIEMSSYDESENETVNKIIDYSIEKSETDSVTINNDINDDNIQLQPQPSTSTQNPDLNIEIFQLKSLQPSNNNLLEDVQIKSDQLLNDAETEFITPVSNISINKLVLLNTTNVVKDDMEL